MFDRLLALRGTVEPAGTTRHSLAFEALDIRATDRALRWKLHLPRAGGTALRQHAHDLRDHIAGTAHDHCVAYPHILALHLIHVVQRRIAHRHATDEDRLEPRNRRHRAGASHLELHRLDDGEFLLRGELAGDGPARRARDETELPLVGDAVHLEHHPVNLVGEMRAPRADVVEIGDTFR